MVGGGSPRPMIVSQGCQDAENAGLTCIDCHKGIVHSLPIECDPEQDAPGKSIFYFDFVERANGSGRIGAAE